MYKVCFSWCSGHSSGRCSTFCEKRPWKGKKKGKYKCRLYALKIQFRFVQYVLYMYKRESIKCRPSACFKFSLISTPFLCENVVFFKSHVIQELVKKGYARFSLSSLELAPPSIPVWKLMPPPDAREMKVLKIFKGTVV